MTEVDTLKMRVAELERKFSDTLAVLPAEWKLSPQEDRVFRVLLAVDIAGRAAIEIGSGCRGRIIDNYILRIRRKTARFGVVIETVHNRGWRLVGRFTWARSFAAQSAA